MVTTVVTCRVSVVAYLVNVAECNTEGLVKMLCAFTCVFRSISALSATSQRTVYFNLVGLNAYLSDSH